MNKMRQSDVQAWRLYRAEGGDVLAQAKAALNLGWTHILTSTPPPDSSLPFVELCFERPAEAKPYPWILHTTCRKSAELAASDPACLEVTLVEGDQVRSFPAGSAPRCWDPWLQEPQRLDVRLIGKIAESRQPALPRWSVIIPCFRHQDELARTLAALAVACEGQTVEILVIQDLEPQASPLPPLHGLPAAWYHVQRRAARQYGDRGFRAASLRNFGARLSRGECLLFLDADILVPKDLFTSLDSKMSANALVQAKRWHLRNSNGFNRPVHGLSALWDCDESEAGVWEEFQTARQDWNARSEPWGWVSTFCMAVPKERFAAVGGFRESFDSYGFEDTEFGYRFVRHGGSLCLADVDVFHQRRPRERLPEAMARSRSRMSDWMAGS